MDAESKIVLGYGHKWPEGKGLVRENFPIWAVMRGSGILHRVEWRIVAEFAPSSWACDFAVWNAVDFQDALPIIRECKQACIGEERDAKHEFLSEPLSQEPTANGEAIVEALVLAVPARRADRDRKPIACTVCKSTRGDIVLFKQIGRGIWAHDYCFHQHYKMITRGPRKGQWAWKHNWKRKRERAIWGKNVAAGLTSPIQIEPVKVAQPDSSVGTWLQGIGELLGICVLLFLPYLLLIVVINFLSQHNLGWLVLPIFLIDALGAIFYRRANRPRKHIPFFWIFR